MRKLQPMNLPCPHSDLHILYIKPMLGKFKGRIRTYYPATAAAECSLYNTLSWNAILWLLLAFVIPKPWYRMYMIPKNYLLYRGVLFHFRRATPSRSCVRLELTFPLNFDIQLVVRHPSVSFLAYSTTSWAFTQFSAIAPAVGLEPTTLWLTVRCYHQLSYTGI